MSDLRGLFPHLARRTRVAIDWWRRRTRVERVLILAGLVVLAP